MTTIISDETPCSKADASGQSAIEKNVKILVVQPSEIDPGGNLTAALENENTTLDILKLDRGDQLPTSLENYDGMVVLGGAQHAFDDITSPYFPDLMGLMRSCEDQSKPLLTVCLGAQLLARAYGGKVYTMETLEFGFLDHELTREGELDPVVGTIAPKSLMEFHEDSFTMPEGSTLLIRGENCPNQCFRVGKVSYGFQFHLEADSNTASHWAELLQQGGSTEYAKYKDIFDEKYFAKFRTELAMHSAKSQAFCNGIARNWVQLVRDLNP